MDDDEPHKIWFYSRDGEKHGPVTFTDLRAKAKDASLNPRLDMVWTKGMDEWKPAGDIEGLFKRRAAPEPAVIPAVVPATDPYQPPQEETVEDQMVKQSNWPGARRRSYLLLSLVFPFLWAFVIAAAAGILTTQFGPEIMTFAAPGLSLIPLMVIIYISLKRLVNLGMSRWWFLGNFVPFLNLWVGYRCFACPAGYAFHKKLDSAGIFLAIVYWLLLAVAVLAVAALFGALGSPEVQRQIEEIIRTATAPKP
ncbi:MAG: GYF domain-containing protein [Verrucomicrobiota bacterium]